MEHVPLTTVFRSYQDQYRATVKVYEQHKTSLPVAMWPAQKAPRARLAQKSGSTPRQTSYHDVVRQLEIQAVAAEHLNTLHVNLSVAQQAAREAVEALEHQKQRRDIQQQQGQDLCSSLELPSTMCICWVGLPVQAMDEGILAAQVHHQATAELSRRGEFAESAFMAQREVNNAKYQLQQYQQELQVVTSSTGN